MVDSWIVGTHRNAQLFETKAAIQKHAPEEEAVLAIIPKPLHERINIAFPANVCLVATVLPNGYAQVSRFAICS